MPFPGIHPFVADCDAGRSGLATLLLQAGATPTTASGRPVRFAVPPEDGAGYEQRIRDTGLVATRPDDLHDLFNAQVWLNFPRTKARINALHVDAIARVAGAAAAGRRGPLRDALTHFDECGAIVVSRRPDLLEMLRGFRWAELFCGQRDAVVRDMALIVFGHATLAALVSPHRGLTVKAFLEAVPGEWFGLGVGARLADVDARLLRRLDLPLAPSDLQPLPLLGWPGVVPASEDPAYYRDSWQFRPGRRSGAV